MKPFTARPTLFFQCLLIVSVLGGSLPPITSSAARPESAAARAVSAGAPPSVDALPLSLQYALSSDIGYDDPIYHLASISADELAAYNPRTGLSIGLTPAGLTLRDKSDSWSINLSRWGRGNSLVPALPVSSRSARSNRLEYRRGGLTEWYVHGPLGLQQGWTLAEPPVGGDGALTLILSHSGTLDAQVDSGRRSVSLIDGTDALRWRYGGLFAHDAGGRELNAWFEQKGEELWVRVDDAGATYPLTIDPWVQAARLTTSSGSDGDQLGWSVAMSDDGSTIVVGAPKSNVDGAWRGAVYVYERPGDWASTPLYAARLTAGDGSGVELFGWSVAVDANGDTVAVGAPLNGSAGADPGAAYLYLRPPGGWRDVSETAKLTASDAADQDWLGHSVALSGDGSTVVAGAPHSRAGGTDRGRIYVFTQAAGGWEDATQSAILTAGDGADFDRLGHAVSVSGDGRFVVAGAPRNDASGDDRGAVYVFSRSSLRWEDAAHTAKLTAGDAADSDWFGSAVDLSRAGETLIVGAPFNDAGGSNRGAAYVYRRPSGGWADATHDAKLTALGSKDEDLLGQSVALSSDGQTVVAGAHHSGAGGFQRGAAYIFARPARGWINTSQIAGLMGSDSADGDMLGRAVAVSADGSLAIAGAHYNHGGGFQRGAAYVFGRQVSGWSSGTQLAKLTASDGGDGDRLGWSTAVSADGRTVVVGAPFAALGGTERGAVYVYARADDWSSTGVFSAKLSAGDAQDYDRVGWSVAVSKDGDAIVAGAPNVGAGGVQRGAVYVFAQPVGGWADTDAFTARLTASDGGDYDLLGTAVTVSGDGNTIVVGAPQNDARGSNQGTAVVYARPSGGWTTTGTYAAKLLATDGEDDDRFGTAVALSRSGDTIVVGAPYKTTLGTAGAVERGTVYVYARPTDGWANASQTAALIASDGADGDHMGWSVAASWDGEVVVAGAPFSAVRGSKLGAAYVFTRPAGGWRNTTQISTLSAGDGVSGDALGSAVAVSDDGRTVVAGAPFNTAGGAERGAAYIYRRPASGWVTNAIFATKLIANDSADLDRFGSALAVDAAGHTLVTGVPYLDFGGVDRGAAFVYTLLTTLQFTSGTPPSPVYIGEPYSFVFSASGEPPPTYSVTSGAFPKGLTLNHITGLISGIPSDAGRYVFTVTAHNGVATPAMQVVTISVMDWFYLPLIVQ